MLRQPYCRRFSAGWALILGQFLTASFSSWPRSGRVLSSSRFLPLRGLPQPVPELRVVYTVDALNSFFSTPAIRSLWTDAAVIDAMEEMSLAYPRLNNEQRVALEAARAELEDTAVTHGRKKTGGS